MPKPTKAVTIEDERFVIRSMTWDEIQEIRGGGAKPKKKTPAAADRVGEIVMGCVVEGNVGGLSVRDGISALCREIWAFTNGTDAQLGNSSSTGAAVPPSGASTAEQPAAEKLPPIIA